MIPFIFSSSFYQYLPPISLPPSSSISQLLFSSPIISESTSIGVCWSQAVQADRIMTTLGCETAWFSLLAFLSFFILGRKGAFCMAALPFVFSCFFFSFYNEASILADSSSCIFFIFFLIGLRSHTLQHYRKLLLVLGAILFFAFISEQHHLFFFSWLGVILGWLSFSLFKTVQISRYPPVRFCVSWHFLVYLLSWSLFFLGSQ